MIGAAKSGIVRGAAKSGIVRGAAHRAPSWAVLLAIPFLTASCDLLLRAWVAPKASPAAITRSLETESGEPVDFEVAPDPGASSVPLPSLTPGERSELERLIESATGAADRDPGTSPEPSASPGPAGPLLPDPQLGGFDVRPRLDVCLGPDPPAGCPDGIPAMVVELIEREECPPERRGDEIVICEVAVDPHPETAEISWRTDRPTSGSVEWLTAPLAGREIEAYYDPDLGEDRRSLCSEGHSVTLDRLVPATDYEFQVQVRDCEGGPREASDIHAFRTTVGEPAAIEIIWVDARLANRVWIMWWSFPDAPSQVTWWEQEAGPAGRLAPPRQEGRVIGELNGHPVRLASLPTRASTAYWFQVGADNLGALTSSEIGSFTTPGGVVEFQLEPVTIFDPAYVEERYGQYDLMLWEQPPGRPSEVARVYHWCTDFEGATSLDFLGREVADDPPYWCQVGPGDELVGGMDPPEYDADVTVFCRELIEWVGLCVWRERLDRGPPEPDTCVGIEVEYSVQDVERLGPLRLKAVPRNLGIDIANEAQLIMSLFDASGRVTLGCLTSGLLYDVYLDAPGLGWHGAPVIEFSVRGADDCCPTFPQTSGHGPTYHPHPVVSVPEITIVEAPEDATDPFRIELTLTDERDRVLCRREVRTDVVGRAVEPGLVCDVPVLASGALDVELSVWGEAGHDAHERWTFAPPRNDRVATRAEAGRAIRLETAPEDGFRLDLWLVLRWDRDVL